MSKHPSAAPRRPARSTLMLTLTVLAGLLFFRRTLARTGASLDALTAENGD